MGMRARGFQRVLHVQLRIRGHIRIRYQIPHRMELSGSSSKTVLQQFFLHGGTLCFFFSFFPSIVHLRCWALFGFTEMCCTLRLGIYDFSHLWFTWGATPLFAYLLLKPFWTFFLGFPQLPYIPVGSITCLNDLEYVFLSRYAKPIAYHTLLTQLTQIHLDKNERIRYFHLKF